MFTNEPMDGKEAYRCGWASAIFPAESLQEETEKIAAQIALTPTDLIMLTKRSINHQLELMGFRTGCAWSADMLAISGRRPSVAREGDEFRKIALEKGLKAALDWRDSHRGVHYRTSDKAKTLKAAT